MSLTKIFIETALKDMKYDDILEYVKVNVPDASLERQGDILEEIALLLAENLKYNSLSIRMKMLNNVIELLINELKKQS